MSQIRLNQKSVLDKQMCYELWVKERKSIYRIPKLLAERGIVNPKTGKYVTGQAVWNAASKFILENPNLAKSDTVSILSQTGQLLDEHQWGIDMISRAKQFLGRKKYRAFLAKYPEYKPYAEE